MAYALRRWVLVPETLRSFRISSLLCSSAPLRFDTVYSEHGEILKRRGKEEQRKTEERVATCNRKQLKVLDTSAR